MNRNNWEVGKYAVRPAGKDDRCFYCGALLKEQHNKGCVIRSKTVVIKMEIDLVVNVPEDWEAYDVDFKYNESSHCAGNIINELKQLDKRVGCLCGYAKFEYVREATIEDEEKQKVFVDKIRS